MATPQEDIQQEEQQDTLLAGTDTLQEDMDIHQGAMDTPQEVTLLDTPLQEDTLLEDMDTPLGDMDTLQEDMDTLQEAMDTLQEDMGTLQEDMDTLQEVTQLDIPTLDLLEVDTTQDIPMENRNLND